MSDGAVGNAGTTAVREGYGFDAARLSEWMAAHVEGFAGPLSVEQFKGGQSNPTYKLVTPGRSYVLRRKPPGQLLKGAHAVEREAKVLSALGGAGFPVPHVHGLCTDDEVIGTWFYVMDMVDGRIVWDATFPDVDRADRAAYFDAMNETIARLHSVDFAAIGLADYGRPGNYFERQIARWSRQYLEDPETGGHAHERCAAVGHERERDAGDRHDPDDHPKVHEHLEQQGRREARAEHRPERVARLPAAGHDPPQQRPEQQEQQDRTDEPELLEQDRGHEVALLDRQELAAVLGPVREPGAQQATGADRDL